MGNAPRTGMARERKANTLNLDDLEREGSKVKPPFYIVLGEVEYHLPPPDEMTFETLASTPNNVIAILRASVPENQRRTFDAEFGKLPGWKVDKLGERYAAHYGLADPGEDDASPA